MSHEDDALFQELKNAARTGAENDRKSRLRRITAGMTTGAVTMLAPLPLAFTSDDPVAISALVAVSSVGSAVATLSCGALNRLSAELAARPPESD